MMRLSEGDYERVKRVWPEQYPSYDAATKIVYGWVKQDKISPKQMAELIEIAYKHFVY